MINNHFFQRAVQLFIMFAVPILLTVASIRLVMSYQFLSFEYQRPDFPIDFYGFTTEDRLNYAPYAIDYLLNGEDIDFLADLRLPIEKCWQPSLNADDCAMYQEDALSHMVDVKEVTEITFKIATTLAIITLVLLALGLYNRVYRHALRRGLKYGSVLTLSLIFTIVIVALTTWDFFFDTFHEIFFEEGTWRFAFSDTLIRLFPEKFWFDASLIIGILTTASAFLILILIWFWERKQVSTETDNM